MIRRWRIVTALVGLGLVAAGCNSSDSASAEVDPTTTQPGIDGSESTSTSAGESGAEDVAEDGEPRAALVGAPDSVVAASFTPVLIATLDGSLSEELVEESFTDFFLSQVSPAVFVTQSAQLPALLGRSPVVADIQVDTTYSLIATLLNPDDGSMWDLIASAEIDPPHRLTTYTIVPAPAPAADDSIATLADAETAWADLGTQADLLVSEIAAGSAGEECGTTSDPLAIGSAFKLYVLGAVAGAVETGERSWTDEIAIVDDYRSLPSGQLQVEPAGATLTVAEAAELMLGISDNTAADHLIGLVGRDAVEAELAVLGQAAPELNQPMLMTLEFFKLKLGDPIRLGLYQDGAEDDRRSILADLETEPLPEVSPGALTAPTAIGVEWFASTADLCRAMVALDARGAEGQPEIQRALQAGRGLALDRRSWPTVAFKGGSEPGVLSATWLAERGDGQRFVVSGIVNDPDEVVDTERAFAIARRVFDLLADV